MNELEGRMTVRCSARVPAGRTETRDTDEAAIPFSRAQRAAIRPATDPAPGGLH